MSNMIKYIKSGDEYGAKKSVLIAKSVAQKFSVSVEVLNYIALDNLQFDAGQMKC